MKKSLSSQFSPHLLLLLLFLAASAPGRAQYCVPTGAIDCTDDDRATNVTFAGINHNPSCNATTGYNDYTASVTPGNVVQGSSYPISVSVGTTSDYAAVWIDYNQNNTFDASEFTILNGGSSSTTAGQAMTGTIAIPAGALSGTTRMRVRVRFSTAITGADACFMSGLYGEVTDYNVVIGSLTCSGTPTPGTTNAAATAVACNATTTLSLTGNTSGPTISYQWQYNTSGTWINFGTNAATQTTPPITQTTQFRCRVTCTSTGGGTADATPVSVSVNSIAVNLGNDTTICPGVTYTLDAGNAGATYAWNTGASTKTINVNTAGTYSVAVTLPSGCSGSDAITITPGIVPVNVLPATTNLCSGETATLNAGNAGSTFSWTPGSATTQTINVTAAGTYTAQIKSMNGCVISSSTNVVIRPLPVPSLGSDTAICRGDAITLDAANPGYSYDWSTGATTQAVSAADSGTYTVTITTPYHCTLTDDKHIAYLPSPLVEGFNFIPLFYEDLGKVKFSPLNPTNVYAYEWDFGDNSPGSTDVNPLHVYAASGYYNVTLKVFNGCGDFSISQTINVDLTTGIVVLNTSQADMILYPNPSRNQVTIDNRNQDLRMEQVTVFNVLGAVVYDRKADSGGQHKLAVSGLAAGVYTVRILTDKGFVIRKFEVLH